MNYNKISKLIKVVEETNVSSLKISWLFGMWGVYIQKRGSYNYCDSAQNPVSDKDSSAKTIEKAVKPEPESVYVKAPHVGTFYWHKYTKRKKPRLMLGSKIKKDQVVGFYETVKIMHEIKSPCSGSIEKIFVEHAQLVEYGQKLFKIKPKT